MGRVVMPLRVQTTLGDLRRKTANLPDDTAVFFMVEDCREYREISDLLKFFPAALDAPPALILQGGQEFDEDHHLGPRLDVWHEYGEFL